MDSEPKRGRPRKATDKKATISIQFRATPETVRWIDEEWHRRKLPAKGQLIRVLLEEAVVRDVQRAALVLARDFLMHEQNFVSPDIVMGARRIVEELHRALGWSAPTWESANVYRG